MPDWWNPLTWFLPSSSQPPTTTTPPPQPANQGLVQSWYSASQAPRAAPQQTSQPGTAPSPTQSVPPASSVQLPQTTVQPVTYHEYISETTPLSFRIQRGINELVGILYSPQVLEARVANVLFPSSQAKSNVIEAQQTFEKGVQSQPRDIITAITFPSQSYVLQNITAGAAIGVASEIGISALRLTSSGIALRTVESAPMVSRVAAIASRNIEPIAVYGGLALYGADIAGKVLAEPTTQGKITKAVSTGIGEIAPGFPGASSGFKLGQKLVSRGTTFGLTELPLSKITELSIIGGEQMFPTPSRGETIIESMQKYKVGSEFSTKYNLPEEYISSQYAGYHASPEMLAGGKVGSSVGRGTDVPGLYIAPSASIYFTRVASEKESPSGIKQIISSLWESSPLSPQIHRVYFEELGRLPTSARTSAISSGAAKSLPEGEQSVFQEATQFLKTSATRGKGYITPAFEAGKMESEIVISPETTFRRISPKYRTDIGGIKVSIPGLEMSYEGSGTRLSEPSGKTTVSKTFVDLSSQLYESGRYGTKIPVIPSEFSKSAKLKTSRTQTSNISSVLDSSIPSIEESRTAISNEPSSYIPTSRNKPVSEIPSSYIPEIPSEFSKSAKLKTSRTQTSNISSVLDSSIPSIEESRTAISNEPSSYIPTSRNKPVSEIPSSYIPEIPSYTPDYSNSKITRETIEPFSYTPGRYPIESLRAREMPEPSYLPHSIIITESSVEPTKTPFNLYNFNLSILEGKKKRKVKRKITSYLIQNPLADLEDLLGSSNAQEKQTSKKTKNSNMMPEFKLPEFNLEFTTRKKKSNRR